MKIYFGKSEGYKGENRHHPAFWLPFPVFRLQVISYTMILKRQFTISKKTITIPEIVPDKNKRYEKQNTYRRVSS